MTSGENVCTHLTPSLRQMRALQVLGSPLSGEDGGSTDAPLWLPGSLITRFGVAAHLGQGVSPGSHPPALEHRLLARGLRRVPPSLRSAVSNKNED